jgi:glyoxylase-like metal-dependent hydrolase (beta-lactamase superfamily II)
MQKPSPECIEGVYALHLPLARFENLDSSNMYVIGTGPVTLVDTVPRLSGSLDTLGRQLEAAGFSWSDVERILLTHGHMDHFGLVGSIRREASRNIPCHIHSQDKWRLSSDYISSGMWNDELDRFYERAGVPEGVLDSMKRRLALFRNICEPVDDALPMEDGDVFEGPGFELRVVYTPGHSSGCCCFYEPGKRILFSGDHLLKNITPNPFHEVLRSRLRDPGYRSLEAYMASLESVESLDVCMALPGHGPLITGGVPSLVRGYREHHERRMEVLARALGPSPRSLYELALDLFPSVDDHQLSLAVSEVVVHLEILIDRGAAFMKDPGPPELYVRA